MHRRMRPLDRAAEVTCAVCPTTGVINAQIQNAPRGWRYDYDGRLYCPSCICAYVRPDIEARARQGRWSR